MERSKNNTNEIHELHEVEKIISKSLKLLVKEIVNEYNI